MISSINLSQPKSTTCRHATADHMIPRQPGLSTPDKAKQNPSIVCARMHTWAKGHSTTVWDPLRIVAVHLLGYDWCSLFSHYCTLRSLLVSARCRLIIVTETLDRHWLHLIFFDTTAIRSQTYCADVLVSERRRGGRGPRCGVWIGIILLRMEYDLERQSCKSNLFWTVRRVVLLQR